MTRLAVMGCPVAHSISPLLHNHAIATLGLCARYERILVEDGARLREIFDAQGLSGANVTLPHKERACAICDELSSEARAIGSVNTLVLRDGRLMGFNTDAQGFWSSISGAGFDEIYGGNSNENSAEIDANLRDNGTKFGEISDGKISKFAGKSAKSDANLDSCDAGFGAPQTALLLGAGGAARAIAYILGANGVKFDVINRSARPFDFAWQNFYTFADLGIDTRNLNENSLQNLDKISAQNLDEISPLNSSEISAQNVVKIANPNLQKILSNRYDIVINSTSAGLADDTPPLAEPILRAVLARAKFATDIIYGRETPFLRIAREAGVPHKDGLDMLISQAAHAFCHFFGRDDYERVFALMCEARRD